MLAVANLCYALASRIMCSRFLLHHISPSSCLCTVPFLLLPYNLIYDGFLEPDWIYFDPQGGCSDGPWHWVDSFVYTSLVV